MTATSLRCCWSTCVLCGAGRVDVDYFFRCARIWCGGFCCRFGCGLFGSWFWSRLWFGFRLGFCAGLDTLLVLTDEATRTLTVILACTTSIGLTVPGVDLLDDVTLCAYWAWCRSIAEANLCAGAWNGQTLALATLGTLLGCAATFDTNIDEWCTDESVFTGVCCTTRLSNATCGLVLFQADLVLSDAAR